FFPGVSAASVLLVRIKGPAPAAAAARMPPVVARNRRRVGLLMRCAPLRVSSGRKRPSLSQLGGRARRGVPSTPMCFFRLAMLSTALLFSTNRALAATIHIAVDGNDSNPGSAEKPFATFERAPDA